MDKPKIKKSSVAPTPNLVAGNASKGKAPQKPKKNSTQMNTKPKVLTKLPKQPWTFSDYENLIVKLAIALAIIFPITFVIFMLSNISKSIK